MITPPQQNGKNSGCYIDLAASPSFQNERSANKNLSSLAAQITKITSSMALFFPEMEYQLTKPSGTGGG